MGNITVEKNTDLFNRYCNCCEDRPYEHWEYYKITIHTGNNRNITRLCKYHMLELKEQIKDI